jgi:hypothetical protein
MMTEQNLNAPMLAAESINALGKECSTLARREMIVHLPKLRVEPPLMQLRNSFQALGMKTAFDLPRGSANFEGIAPGIPTITLQFPKYSTKHF